jgi:hypothetical protein
LPPPDGLSLETFLPGAVSSGRAPHSLHAEPGFRRGKHRKGPKEGAKTLHKFFNLKVLSLLGGLALVAVAALLNVHHAAESEDTWYLSPVCVAIMAMAFGSALAFAVMLNSLADDRRGLALLAVVGLICSEYYGLQLSAERLLVARDQRAQQVRTANAPRELAREALDDLVRDRNAECKSGFEQRCTELKTWEDKKRTALPLTSAPRSHSLIADLTGLPAWLVEIIPAKAFSNQRSAAIDDQQV